MICRSALVLILSLQRCRDLHNYSSMVAIISGLNAVPVRRLKRTWELVNARFLSQLNVCESIIDPNRNFTNYRSLLGRIFPPCVPYIGQSCIPRSYQLAWLKCIQVYSWQPWHSYKKVVRIPYPPISSTSGNAKRRLKSYMTSNDGNPNRIISTLSQVCWCTSRNRWTSLVISQELAMGRHFGTSVLKENLGNGKMKRWRGCCRRVDSYDIGPVDVARLHCGWTAGMDFLITQYFLLVPCCLCVFLLDLCVAQLITVYLSSSLRSRCGVL